jgi:hypothetical protein
LKINSKFLRITISKTRIYPDVSLVPFSRIRRKEIRGEVKSHAEIKPASLHKKYTTERTMCMERRSEPGICQQE